VKQEVAERQSRANKDYYGGNIPWVKSGELREDVITDTEEKITARAIKESSAKIVPSGAILLAMYGATVGRMAFLGVDAATNQAVCNIRPDPTKAISQGIIRETKIPLPPLDEQRRIAAILDKADALRRKRKHALELLDMLTRSIFSEMFEEGAFEDSQYTLLPISEIASLVTDGEHQTPKRTSAGIKLLSARNIQMGYIDTRDVDFVDEKEYERISKRLVLRPSDVLISCSGTIGRVSLLQLTEPIALVRSVAVIRPKDMIVPLYLEYYLRGPRMQSVMKAAANSSGQPNLFQNQIKRLEIVVPPIKLQNLFARKVEKVRSLIPLFAVSERFSHQFFSSLQSRAFSGRL
jgi:type I restriction enzyme S subunit